MSKLSFAPVVLLGSVALAGACERNKSREEPSTTPETARIESTASSAVPSSPATVSVQYLGSCEPAPELTNILARIADTADSNGNGQIEKEEAYAASDFLIGGFFFYADKNSDGTVSPEEGRAAREQLMARYPSLTSTLTAGGSPRPGLKKLADLLGVEYAQGVTNAEMRAVAHRVTDEIFDLADSNRDSSLTLAEAQAAGHDRMRALASAAFEANDANDDQFLTLDEFRSALDQPTRLAFQAADANKDGKLSQPEAGSAVRGAVRRLWVPAATTGVKPVTTN